MTGGLRRDPAHTWHPAVCHVAACLLGVSLKSMSENEIMGEGDERMDRSANRLTIPDPSALPSGLRHWLRRRGWRVTGAAPIIGGYAASLFKLRVEDADGLARNAVYKRFAKGREQEALLYGRVFAGIPDLVPQVLGHIKEGDEAGILMAYAGETVKTTLKRLQPAERTRLLMDAVLRLADMHIQFEACLAGLIERGLLSRYPLQSSISWAHFSLGMLKMMDSVEEKRIETMSDWFYPRYEKWLHGRITLTHGDPHLENILISGGGFRLIDWEASCAAVPQRDLAVFLQDVLDGGQHAALRETYLERLRSAGWNVNHPEFNHSFEAVFFDNTLMMLGWEIYKYREGHLAFEEISAILRTKIGWMEKSFLRLYD